MTDDLHEAGPGDEPVWIDGHCHLSDPRLAGDLDGVLGRARLAGVGRFVLGGVGPEDWKRQQDLMIRYPGVFVPIFGIHPWWVRDKTQGELEVALESLENSLPAAAGLGELGLDWGARAQGISREMQAWIFERQLALAVRRNRPLVLHCVKAHFALLETLEKQGIPQAGGLVHSFSGDERDAEAYVKLGLHLSLSGAVTKSGFNSLRKAVKQIPADRLILETDSPDQPPLSWPRPLNEPASLLQVARATGAIRNEDPVELLQSSASHLSRIFKLGVPA